MDPRFDTSKDARFRPIARNVRKVQIDKRFEKMFTDKSFAEQASVDKTGRKIKKDNSQRKLRAFYDMPEEKEEAEVKTGKRAKKKSSKVKKGTKKDEDPSKEEAEAEAEEEDDEADDDAGAADVDDAVEEGDDEGSEEDDEDDDEEDESEDESDDDEEDENVQNLWERQQENVPHGDASRRLAIMGCDWDQVSAKDLLVMLRSYLFSRSAKRSATSARTVDKVTVYPSDFGLEMMRKEAAEGPQIEADTSEVKTLQEHKEDEKVQSEALRAYQLRRTKYYWALAECNSVETASFLYDELDGMEASNMTPASLDLRFVPDDIEPPHEPTSVATETPKKYQAPEQAMSALSHSKVKCTWDEAPKQRKRDLQKKKFTAAEVMDADLQTYLASSSGEEDAETAEALKKLARGGESGDDESDFFASGSDKEEMGDMEQTFSLKATQLEEELEEKTKKERAAGGKNLHTLKNGGEDAEEDKSLWQKYLDKRKAKRKERKQQAKAERDEKKAQQRGEDPDAKGKKGRKKGKNADDEEEEEKEADDLDLLTDPAGEDRGFNWRGSQRQAHKGLTKRQQAELEKQDGSAGAFKVNPDDPRISAVFATDDFEIDPTNPEFRKTEGMGTILQKKRQRKAQKNAKAASASTATATTNAASTAEAAAAAAPTNGGSQKKAAASNSGSFQLFGGKNKKKQEEEQHEEGAEVGTNPKKKAKRNA